MQRKCANQALVHSGKRCQRHRASNYASTTLLTGTLARGYSPSIIGCNTCVTSSVCRRRRRKRNDRDGAVVLHTADETKYSSDLQELGVGLFPSVKRPRHQSPSRMGLRQKC